MQFTVNKESITRSLQLVCGIVARRPTLPVLSHVLLNAGDSQLKMTTTDMELEMVTACEATISKKGSIAVPARKIFDICRTLPEMAEISLTLTKTGKATVTSGTSRFTLNTLPGDDFPDAEGEDYTSEINIAESALKSLIDETSFAMGKDDARYYLNGMLMAAEDNKLLAVATDGHRMALATTKTITTTKEKSNIIMPRKAIVELGRLLTEDDSVTMAWGDKSVRVIMNGVRITSRLIDGQFPDYERVIPAGGDLCLKATREALRSGLMRAAILASEGTPSVCFSIDKGTLRATTTSDGEQADIDIDIDYAGEHLEIAFNNTYLLDVLGTMPADKVQMTFTNNTSSVLIEPVETDEGRQRQYVVMPMRL